MLAVVAGTLALAFGLAILLFRTLAISVSTSLIAVGLAVLGAGRIAVGIGTSTNPETVADAVETRR